MKPATAIRTLLNDGPVCSQTQFYPKVTIAEIREFKEACIPAEYLELAKQACDILGETFEE